MQAEVASAPLTRSAQVPNAVASDKSAKLPLRSRSAIVDPAGAVVANVTTPISMPNVASKIREVSIADDEYRAVGVPIVTTGAEV